MEAPPGGPTDTKRPYVTAVLPAPDSVRVGPELDVKIKFSEWVAPDAERGKVYLVPPLTRKIKARLSGDELQVTSAGRLDTNTTYILGLLGTIKDINGQPTTLQSQLLANDPINQKTVWTRDWKYSNQVPVMATAGDLLFLYTDGCVEAENEHLEMFGMERLESLLMASAASRDPLKHVEDVIAKFRGKSEPSDDATLMTVRVG